ncbi:MAG: macrolide ABC transporter ATP-binding protein [Thermoplasmata archaeon HGW-Thermoplasmata-1]|nr:MAG: macrolide ABC transporter ATP-binding protein [Thermoplasmata archaeon HGW-Thermoplasmata-1]
MAVEARAVDKVYKLGKAEYHALKDINLNIEKGEFISIMGPSGCGKSTLLNLIGCLDTATAGRLRIGGNDVSAMNENELARLRSHTIGFIFQTFNLIPRTSALKNVELAMIFAGVPRETRRKRARMLLEKVGLGDRMWHAPNELSGGERQRISIARALSNNPSMILADEPTGNLDSKRGTEIMEIIRGLKEREGKTVIMVTHDKDIARYADRIYHMKDGAISEVESVLGRGDS